MPRSIFIGTPVKFRTMVLRKVLWNLACAHDGIPAESEFAIFSPENPWMEKLNDLNCGEDIDLIGFRL